MGSGLQFQSSYHLAMLPPFTNHEPLITVPHALVSPKLISTFSLGVLGGLVNGRAYIRGAYKIEKALQNKL